MQISLPPDKYQMFLQRLNIRKAKKTIQAVTNSGVVEFTPTYRADDVILDLYGANSAKGEILQVVYHMLR